MEKEKIRGSAGRSLPLPSCTHTRVHPYEGGSKAGKRGTERMARLGSVGKIKLGRPERSPLDRLLYSFFFPLRSLLRREREIDRGLYTRPRAYACARQRGKEREKELNLRHERSPWLRAWRCSLPLNLVLRLARRNVDLLSWLYFYPALRVLRTNFLASRPRHFDCISLP